MALAVASRWKIGSPEDCCFPVSHGCGNGEGPVGGLSVSDGKDPRREGVPGMVGGLIRNMVRVEGPQGETRSLKSPGLVGLR